MLGIAGGSTNRIEGPVVTVSTADSVAAQPGAFSMVTSSNMPMLVTGIGPLKLAVASCCGWPFTVMPVLVTVSLVEAKPPMRMVALGEMFSPVTLTWPPPVQIRRGFGCVGPAGSIVGGPTTVTWRVMATSQASMPGFCKVAA